MSYSRPHWGWFLCLFVLSLPLFFGLFFGLNYKEIIRNGWPLTTCTVNNATLSTRYCCYSDCSPSCFASAPNGATTCGDLINQVNGGYSPAACAANSSVCPEAIGTICDGGYHCCNYCPTSSSSCSQSCTTSPTQWGISDVIVIAVVLPIIANARSAALLVIPSTSSCPIHRTMATPNQTSPTRKTFPKTQAVPKPFWQITQSTQRQNVITIPKV
ncbi:hypothetical protein IW261DRAFT_1442667 [Armillaria novae-zelandiae]|uniref:Uncharacterized protein n=1 Tax=Armillaria novae-zelandiae TaxID=153914 RepID=A0AA39UMD9_9AGAR|nr:hypothetical protein IW261DRAFT_1442667 [Armillaria novae-zelandiae]